MGAAVPTGPSESLLLQVAGAPEGAALSAGTADDDGNWVLTPVQLAGLSLLPPENYNGYFTLAVSATASDGEDTAEATQRLPVTVEPVADPSSLTVSDATGDEDAPIPLEIRAVATGRTESLSVSIAGIPAVKASSMSG